MINIFITGPGRKALFLCAAALIAAGAGTAHAQDTATKKTAAAESATAQVLEAEETAAMRNREMPSARDITATVKQRAEERARANEALNEAALAQAEAAGEADIEATAAPQNIVKDLTAVTPESKPASPKAAAAEDAIDRQADITAETGAPEIRPPAEEAPQTAEDSDAIVDAESTVSTSTIKGPAVKSNPTMMGTIQDAEDAVAAEVEHVEEEIIHDPDADVTLDETIAADAAAPTDTAAEEKPRSKHKRWWGRPY